MDKQKILEWVNTLIGMYEQSENQVIDEYSTCMEDYDVLKENCKELRKEIKELLEL